MRALLMVIAACLTVAIIAAFPSADADNTPPSVTLETPGEGALLGVSVTISGTASDVEGFNVSSYVEARWNDWEWFRLPSNPGGGGKLLAFGELVDLAWHAPGDHFLLVRAYDGELYSPEVNLTVTVRDLADLVVMPTDITLDDGGDTVDVVVVVRNQGGEDATGVVVVVESLSIEAGRATIALVGAGASAMARVPVEVRAGELELVVSVSTPGLERSTDNNAAHRTLTVPEDEEAEAPSDSVLVAGGIVVAVIIVAAGVMSRPRQDAKV